MLELAEILLEQKEARGQINMEYVGLRVLVELGVECPSWVRSQLCCVIVGIRYILDCCI